MGLLYRQGRGIINPRGSFLCLINGLYSSCSDLCMLLEIQLDALMGSLNRKGERELSLYTQLEIFYDRIWSVYSFPFLFCIICSIYYSGNLFYPHFNAHVEE